MPNACLIKYAIQTIGGFNLRVLVTAIIIFFDCIMQSTLFNYIQIREIKPNTAIAIVISYAILRGRYEGAICGFFTGLLADIFCGYALGHNALIFMYLGILCGAPTENFYRENLLLPLLFTFIGTLISGLYFYVTGFLFKGYTDIIFFSMNIILPEVIYTSITSLIIYRILYAINKKLESHEKGKQKMF